ncbi:Vgb family protein [Streptomyces lavendulocolor]|uniref:Vgb family protein n=1 Tax=Streptomyces lavendulocolor TaxID=67316 RepID=UPI0033D9463E
MRTDSCTRTPTYHKAAIGLGNASAGGVALDNDGHAYVSNFYTGALNRVDLVTGDFIEVTSFGQANAVALDGHGSAYVTNLYGGTLFKVHLATGLTTAVADRLDYSAGVAVSPDGRGIYVVSALGRLYQVDARSGLRTEIVSGLSDPWGLALDGLGNAYITSQNGYLDVVNLNTKEIRRIATGIGDAYGIALDGAGYAYTSTFRDGGILRINLTTGQFNEAAAGLGNPTSIALSSHGDAYVASTHGILWRVEGVAGCTKDCCGG